jgi:hypothetical protein
MMKWSRMRSIVRRLRLSANAPPTTPRVIASTMIEATTA